MEGLLGLHISDESGDTCASCTRTWPCEVRVEQDKISAALKLLPQLRVHRDTEVIHESVLVELAQILGEYS